MKLKIDIPKPVELMMNRLLATGLYGRTLEECAFRLIGDAMTSKIAAGGILHNDPVVAVLRGGR